MGDPWRISSADDSGRAEDVVPLVVSERLLSGVWGVEFD